MDHITQYLETKDPKFLHCWVEENYKLFYSIVHRLTKRYQLYDFELGDLFSEAVVAFYETIDKYDPSRGEVSTYINHAVPNYMINKFTASKNRDFARRVPTINIDETVEDDNGSSYYKEGTVSISDTDMPMTMVLLGNLDAWVRINLSPKKQKIYTLYQQGMTLQSIAKELGVTKQYVAKVIDNLIIKVREEWNVE